MMKYKKERMNKGFTTLQHSQQSSTENFACQKRKTMICCTIKSEAPFLFPFVKSFSTESTKSTWNKQS